MDAFVSVLQPIESTQALPNSCYTDPVMSQIETKQIFASAWAAIGFGFDVPVSSYVSPVSFLGISLVVVRGYSGKTNVFENVCRLHGMILVEEAKKLRGPISCPYQAWTYDFNGTLRTTPHASYS